MRNQVTSERYSLRKRIVTGATLALTLIASSVPSALNATEKKGTTETPLAVTYLGQVNQQPLLQVDVDNQKEDKLYVTFQDEEGNVLYSEKFKDKKFTKKFRFDFKADENNLNLTFTLSSKNGKPQVVQIKNVVTTVKDVVVTKID